MVTIIKKGMKKKEINSLLNRSKATQKKKIEIEKYCGIINLKEEPIDIQRKLRDEWK